MDTLRMDTQEVVTRLLVLSYVSVSQVEQDMLQSWNRYWITEISLQVIAGIHAARVGGMTETISGLKLIQKRLVTGVVGKYLADMYFKDLS